MSVLAVPMMCMSIAQRPKTLKLQNFGERSRGFGSSWIQAVRPAPMKVMAVVAVMARMTVVTSKTKMSTRKLYMQLWKSVAENGQSQILRHTMRFAGDCLEAGGRQSM
jgi:hypothetical protein